MFIPGHIHGDRIGTLESSAEIFLPRQGVAFQRLRPLFLRAKNAAHIFPLLYPGLQSFATSFDIFKDITGGANEELFGTVLAVLSLSCNGDGLRELVLFHEGCTGFNVKEAHIKCLASFPHLQRFVSQAPLEPAAWMDIGLLQRLKYLDVNLPDLYPSEDVTLTGKTHPLALSGLESLTLRGSLTNTSQFLSQMQASTLCSATFFLDSSPSSPVHCVALESFLSFVQYALPHTLLSFALTCQSIDPFGGPFHVKLWGPLSFFTELQELSIDLSDSPILVSDTEISTLSGALPRLRSLVLLYAYGYSDSMRIRLTIKALVALATGCPDLTHLHLANLNVHAPVKGDATPVEGDVTPVEEDVETTEPEVPALRHRLRVLEIDSFYAKLSNMSYFFLQLHRLFPEVETMGPRDGFESKAKKYVNQLLSIVKSVRQNDVDRGIVLN
ncbi:hypothetical protein LXA43DRAFT_1097706 [Ganoderma leucocontextum]|nr:hypothetical protein LXA43DRAFT_1097706 [Ganoderma leucocontextum]